MSDSTLNSNGEGDGRNPHTPRVVIVGGGFGGLAAAKALGKAPVEVILIDRTNHHVFQPLLYQVATSVLAPSQMSSDRKSTRLNSSHANISYAVFCLKKKKKISIRNK